MRGNGGDRDAVLGKVADTFDSYPYTIKLTGTNNYSYKTGDVNKLNSYSGTITFHSATNLDFYFNGVTYEAKDIYYKYSAEFKNKGDYIDGWVKW